MHAKTIVVESLDPARDVAHAVANLRGALQWQGRAIRDPVRLACLQTGAHQHGMVVALGITFLFFWHVIINIGMCLGLLPVVGIPLPLFSYGGSFLLVMLLGVGLLLNIYIRRFIF